MPLRPSVIRPAALWGGGFSQGPANRNDGTCAEPQPGTHPVSESVATVAENQSAAPSTSNAGTLPSAGADPGGAVLNIEVPQLLDNVEFVHEILADSQQRTDWRIEQGPVNSVQIQPVEQLQEQPQQPVGEVFFVVERPGRTGQPVPQEVVDDERPGPSNAGGSGPEHVETLVKGVVSVACYHANVARP